MQFCLSFHLIAPKPGWHLKKFFKKFDLNSFLEKFALFHEIRHEGVIFRDRSNGMNWSLGPIKQPGHNKYAF